MRKLASNLKQRIDKQVRTLETQPYSGKRLRGEFEGSYSSDSATTASSAGSTRSYFSIVR